MAGHSKWANIKHRKSSQDQKRAKIFQKILRKLDSTLKIGGPNIETNFQLRLIIDQAKAVNMPKENIDRAFKKFQQKTNLTDYEEVVYEGYLLNNVAIIVECLTDNRNRTFTNVRSIFVKNGGTLGVSGSVKYQFNRVGIFKFFKKDLDIDEEKILSWAVTTNALDIQITPTEVIVIVNSDDFWKTKTFFEAEKISEFLMSAIIFQPVITKTLDSNNDKDAIMQFDHVITLLEDDDDVQNVYHNLIITNEAMVKE